VILKPQKTFLLTVKNKWLNVLTIQKTVVSLHYQKRNDMNTIQKVFGTRNAISEFSTRDAAFRYADKCVKLHAVLLGDGGKFWVAHFGDAQKLAKMGYEIAA